MPIKEQTEALIRAIREASDEQLETAAADLRTLVPEDRVAVRLQEVVMNVCLRRRTDNR